ncbi:ORF16 [Fowl aviadenovirus 4]|uniref:ORF16 n=1 Tax=Fowl aviadenovirus 4 TaxID=130663 RepID=A0A7D5PXJ9_FADV4|nr:ORF16 [Fowl aviadenovirus 4]QTE18969.1 ORF16 [Fowl aviadenovirus 4]QZA85747.1 ORF16 [Fowl aviadenovirus 4]UNO37679.1 ORF16 [Fowl aviadenovirus 4]
MLGYLMLRVPLWELNLAMFHDFRRDIINAWEKLDLGKVFPGLVTGFFYLYALQDGGFCIDCFLPCSDFGSAYLEGVGLAVKCLFFGKYPYDSEKWIKGVCLLRNEGYAQEYRLGEYCIASEAVGSREGCIYECVYE